MHGGEYNQSLASELFGDAFDVEPDSSSSETTKFPYPSAAMASENAQDREDSALDANHKTSSSVSGSYRSPDTAAVTSTDVEAHEKEEHMANGTELSAPDVAAQPAVLTMSLSPAQSTDKGDGDFA